jgi:hypothetical protein
MQEFQRLANQLEVWATSATCRVGEREEPACLLYRQTGKPQVKEKWLNAANREDEWKSWHYLFGRCKICGLPAAARLAMIWILLLQAPLCLFREVAATWAISSFSARSSCSKDCRLVFGGVDTDECFPEAIAEVCCMLTGPWCHLKPRYRHDALCHTGQCARAQAFQLTKRRVATVNVVFVIQFQKISFLLFCQCVK